MPSTNATYIRPSGTPRVCSPHFSALAPFMLVHMAGTPPAPEFPAMRRAYGRGKRHVSLLTSCSSC